MSAEAVVLGPDAKVDVNLVPFGVVSGQYRINYDTVDRTDAASTSKRTKQSRNRQIEISLVAQRQSDVSPHAPPLFLTPVAALQGAGVWIRLWPSGRGDPLGPVDVPALVQKSVGGDWYLAGSAPQTLSIEGISDGDFSLPGE